MRIVDDVVGVILESAVLTANSSRRENLIKMHSACLLTWCLVFSGLPMVIISFDFQRRGDVNGANIVS